MNAPKTRKTKRLTLLQACPQCLTRSPSKQQRLQPTQAMRTKLRPLNHTITNCREKSTNKLTITATGSITKGSGAAEEDPEVGVGTSTTEMECSLTIGSADEMASISGHRCTRVRGTLGSSMAAMEQVHR